MTCRLAHTGVRPSRKYTGRTTSESPRSAKAECNNRVDGRHTGVQDMPRADEGRTVEAKAEVIGTSAISFAGEGACARADNCAAKRMSSVRSRKRVGSSSAALLRPETMLYIRGQLPS